ncbi:MAG: 2-succinyl-5-enolpyruvyl-6-hydroxy-3-cyclohexene-1-carboxylic-acid synthase, partial [Chloroflexota bacterium]
ALAFDHHADIEVYIHHDERGAAFSALGMALVTGGAVALVCTSGTALANYFPAVLEAYYAHVPLIVLSADRPHELRGSGANQTMDQLKIFGDHVKSFVDAAPPEALPPAKVTRYLRTLVDRAIGLAIAPPAGPVHLNFPFRKPLAPVPVPDDIPETLKADESFFLNGRPDGLPLTHVQRAIIQPNTAQIDSLTAALQAADRGMIVCGMRCPGGDFPSEVTKLAAVTGLPIFADAFSGVRFSSPEDSSSAALVLGGYETFLASTPSLSPPDLVIHFGAAPLSKNLNHFLSAAHIESRHIIISEHGQWADEFHTVNDVLVANPVDVCRQLSTRLADPQPISPWAAQLQKLESKTWRQIADRKNETFFEGGIVADIMRLAPSNHHIYAASSSVVRHIDQFGTPRTGNLRVYANRGLSGIDGTIASAIGASEGTGESVTLMIGDLAFLHDLNSLSGLLRGHAKLTIILLNNDGGGIFQRLPIREFEPPFKRLFITPHGLSFHAAAQLFGLDYHLVDSAEALDAAYQQAFASDASHLIEIACDSTVQERMRLEINASLDGNTLEGVEEV